MIQDIGLSRSSSVIIVSFALAVGILGVVIATTDRWVQSVSTSISVGPVTNVRGGMVLLSVSVLLTGILFGSLYLSGYFD
jgi:hypothetical protein